jgi:hypothetical protein
VGEDNVVWGTDCLFYGSPQPQIQAFRAFQISDEFQERYGYPALTKELKAKVLGRNAARLYGIEPVPPRCDFTRRELATIREERGTVTGCSVPGRSWRPRTSANITGSRSRRRSVRTFGYRSIHRSRSFAGLQGFDQIEKTIRFLY